MERGLRRGSTLAVVALVVVAAIGGGLIVASLPRDAPTSAARVASRAKAAARALDATDGSQKAYGVMSGVTTYLGALGAFGDEVPSELRRFAAGVESVRASGTRDQQVDALIVMLDQLPALDRTLRAAGAAPSRDAAPAYRQLPDANLRTLRARPVAIDPRSYAAALDDLQARVTSGSDTARAARGRLLDVSAPSDTPASWGLALFGVALVLIALTTGPLLLALTRRHQRLAHEVTTDPLTGVGNRRRLDDDVARALDAPLAVLMIDIDHFKQMNDRSGHPAGDAALRRVADAIQACLREGDTLYRYGGEEFCVLLPGASSDAAAVIAERVRVAVEAVSVPGEDQLPTGRLTVSVGVADATEPDAAIRAADRALYAAKAAGRNRVVTAGAPAV